MVKRPCDSSLPLFNGCDDLTLHQSTVLTLVVYKDKDTTVPSNSASRDERMYNKLFHLFPSLCLLRHWILNPRAS